MTFQEFCDKREIDYIASHGWIDTDLVCVFFGRWEMIYYRTFLGDESIIRHNYTEELAYLSLGTR